MHYLLSEKNKLLNIRTKTTVPKISESKHCYCFHSRARGIFYLFIELKDLIIFMMVE